MSPEQSKLGQTREIDSVNQSNASAVTTKSRRKNRLKVELAEGEFFVHGKFLKDQVSKSLYCLTNKNKVRKLSVWLMRWRWFDNIIMALIVANSVCMGAFDYMDDDAPRNVILNQLSEVFSILFTIEAAIKIIALGFIFGKNTYLRDGWNAIDFLIVVSALLQFGLEHIGGFISLKSLRVLRILRPLKGIKTIPSLRKQVAALLRSVTGLVNVSAFLLFIFILFGIMGLQWFSGSIFYACRVTSAPIPGELVWEKSPLATEAVCSTSGGTNDYNTISGYQCPVNTFCGSPLDYGLTLEDDGVYYNAYIQFGRASFTNIFDSILAVFQIITNDNWTLIIYNLMNSEGMALPATFGVSLIFLGTWLLLNFMLAVIMGEYIEGQQEQAEIERKKAISDKDELERRINSNPTMSQYSKLNTLLQTRHQKTLKQNVNDHHQTMTERMITQHTEKQLVRIENENKELENVLLEAQQSSLVTLDRNDPIFEPIKTTDLLRLELVRENISSQSNQDQDEEQKSQIMKNSYESKEPRNEQIVDNQAEPIDSEIGPETPKFDQADQAETSLENKDELELNALEAFNILKLGNNAMLPVLRTRQYKTLHEVSNNAEQENESDADVLIRSKGLKSSLLSRLGRGMTVKYSKYLKEINRLNKRIKSVNNPEAQSLLTGIHSRVVAAVNIDDLEDKITAVDQIRAEKSFLMTKLEMALHKRYVDTHQQLYGFKNEEQTMKIMNTKIDLMIRNYTNKNASPLKKTNPLAAVFALRNQEESKTHQIDDHDEEIEKCFASGKLRQKTQLKLVMGIKRQFEMDMKNKELLKEISSAFKTIAEERAYMVDITEDYEELMDLGVNESRAEQSMIYQKALELSNSKLFNIFIAVVILANTVELALDQYPIDIESILLSGFLNFVFYLTFLLEMIIRQTATGFKMYFKDEYNTFDFIVVAVSTIDLILLQWFAESITTGYGAIQALRVFRLLRIFKLAKVWPQFNYILKTVFTTLKKIAPFSLLVLIVVFSYTILGLESFSRQLSFDSDGRSVPGDYENGLQNMTGTIPDSNFNNFQDAFLCVFIVIANDGWAPIYYDHVRSMSWFKPTFFFVSLIIIGQYILFQLFLAILLQEFNERSIAEAAHVKIQEEQNKKTNLQLFKEWIRSKLRKMCHCCFDKITDSETSDGSEKEVQHLNSMWLFKTNNPLRKLMITISESKAFENIIIVLIILSSIQLTLENPLLDPHGLQATTLKYCDLVMTILFTFEVIFKVIAHGFLLNGKNSYLRNHWNILDFIIVVISLVSVSIPDESSEGLATFKVIRMARLLRPIRVISKNDGLKIAIQALYVSVPAMLNLLVIVLLFMVIFAIVGVNLFKGKFQYCDIPAPDVIHLSQRQLKTVIVDDFDCYNYGGIWSKYTTAFDNVPEALTQMIAQACTVGWASVMYKAMNSNGPNLQPGGKENYVISLFFCAYIIFGAYFMANLFVGVVISSFNRESENLGKHFLLTDDQKKWIETKLLVVRISPKLATRKPKQRIRALVFNVVEHIYFEYFILVCIGLNTLVLAVYGVNIPKKYIEWTEYANFAFSIVFLFEAIAKLIAFGSRYFHDYWNVFDFVIVIGSLMFIILKYGFRIELFSAATQVIRALRIGRILKLFRHFRQLQVLFKTFFTTLPALMNIGFLMFLIQYIFAVIGMNLFAQIKVKAPMHRWLNFQTIPNSLLTLLRVATGENWNDLMYALGEGYSIKNQCIDNPSYDDYIQAEKNPVGCGTWWLANTYFYFYILLVSLIFLNIFIAIILQGYFQSQEIDDQRLNPVILENFRDGWQKFDPDANGFIEIKHFSELMFALGKPLGWDDSFRDKKAKQAMFSKLIGMHLKTYEKQSKLSFADVLDNITLFFVIRIEVQGKLVSQGIEMNSDDEDDNDSNYDTDDSDHSGDGQQDPDEGRRLPKYNKKDSDSISSSDLEAAVEEVKQQNESLFAKENSQSSSQNRNSSKKKKENASLKYALMKQALIDKKMAEQNTDVKIVRDLQKKHIKVQNESFKFARLDSSNTNLSELLSGNDPDDEIQKLPSKLRKGQSQVFTPKARKTEEIPSIGMDQESDDARLYSQNQKVHKARIHKWQVSSSPNSIALSNEMNNDDSMTEDESLSIDIQEDVNDDLQDVMENNIETPLYSVKPDGVAHVRNFYAGVEVIKEEDEVVEEEETRLILSQNKVQTKEFFSQLPSLSDHRNLPSKYENTRKASSQHETKLYIGSQDLADADLERMQPSQEEKVQELNSQHSGNLVVEK